MYLTANCADDQSGNVPPLEHVCEKNRALSIVSVFNATSDDYFFSRSSQQPILTSDRKYVYQLPDPEASLS